MKLLFAALILFATPAFGLEVDEKLTVRILRTSESRKTVMLNRGTEDGLVEGDHAKFVVTAGIVARAVCVKVSPARSVWSVYRLVNADFILTDAVLSIKITPAVKITKDDSKALVQEDLPTTPASGDGAPVGIPLADGANDLTAGKEDPDDLKAVDLPQIIPERDIEVFGILNISGLTANSKTDTGSESYNSSQGQYHIGLGAELYPQKEREWYSHFSLAGAFNLLRLHNQAYNGSSSRNDVTEFGLGVNWHPTKLPSATNLFIPYFHLSALFGSVRSTYAQGREGNGADGEISANGGTQGFSLGFGYKYYTMKGYGARILLDYYVRSERYGEDEERNKFNKTVGGPRFMIGLGYRW